MKSQHHKAFDASCGREASGVQKIVYTNSYLKVRTSPTPNACPISASITFNLICSTYIFANFPTHTKAYICILYSTFTFERLTLLSRLFSLPLSLSSQFSAADCRLQAGGGGNSLRARCNFKYEIFGRKYAKRI